MHRFFLIPAALCAGLSVGACSASQQAAAQKAIGIGCMVDGAIQPIAAPVLAAAIPSTAGGVTADTLLVHPAIVAACAAEKGVPVATESSAPTTAATPATTAPATTAAPTTAVSTTPAS